jgi:hypothetical protein
MSGPFPLVFALAALPFLAAAESAAAASLDIEYSVSLRGLPIGSARLKADVEGDRYTIDFSGRVKGLVRLFSDGEASASAAGAAADGKLRPAQYSQYWIEDDDDETIRVAFSGATATDISVEPPVKRPERYVPVTEAHRTDVLDPASAFVWPAPRGVTPELCDRTLPIFDGRRRFDLELSFSRTEAFDDGAGSNSGPAVVCAVRYRPIAGHRPNRKSVREMAANEDIEVWMAAAGEAMAAPVRIRIGTKFGRVALNAREFRAE